MRPVGTLCAVLCILLCMSPNVIRGAGKKSAVKITTTAPLDNSSLPYDNATDQMDKDKMLALAGWRFDHLEKYVTITVFLIVVVMMKIVYHHLPPIASYIPESSLLIVIGILFGLIIKFGLGETIQNHWRLENDLFFLVLLPPIILESAYSLYNRNFANNIGTVLIFAVVGTILNYVIIGVSLWLLSTWGAMGGPAVHINILHAFLFSSLIVAVDPVAVLAIFQEIGVDENLYYLVFGESLLNDAVTIVLYNMMQAYLLLPAITGFDILIGICSFFTVSLGGLFVGIIIGILSCLMTRITYVARFLEPIVIMGMGYLSYIAGDLLRWSGIISMIGCGLIQAAYAFHNISRKSRIAVKRFTRMTSSMSEAVIFLFLGLELVTGRHDWHTGFGLWSLVLCLIARALVTLALSAIINKSHISIKSISWTEKFIIAYGGLRGAVAFSLASVVDEKVFFNSGITNDTITTITLFIILFTVIIMGLTMKPIVRYLRIRIREEQKLSLISEINGSVVNHLMAGVEQIVGRYGRNFLYEYFARMDNKYFRRILQRDPMTHDEKILHVFEKINLTLHYASTMPRVDSERYLSKVPERLRTKMSQGLPTISSSSDLQELKRLDDEDDDGDNEVMPKPLLQKLPKRRVAFSNALPTGPDSPAGTLPRVSPSEADRLRRLLRSGRNSASPMHLSIDRDDSDYFTKINAVIKAKDTFLRMRKISRQVATARAAVVGGNAVSASPAVAASLFTRSMSRPEPAAVDVVPEEEEPALNQMTVPAGAGRTAFQSSVRFMLMDDQGDNKGSKQSEDDHMV